MVSRVIFARDNEWVCLWRNSCLVIQGLENQILESEFFFLFFFFLFFFLVPLSKSFQASVCGAMFDRDACHNRLYVDR